MPQSERDTDLENQDLIVAQGMAENTVRLPSGEQRAIPKGWAFLPAGDAFITRRVKKAGPAWTVQVQRGRRKIALGIYADANHIETATRDVKALRSTPEHERKLEQSRERSRVKEVRYRTGFRSAVERFLDFAPMYRELAEAVAGLITDHATPVGSGTVARTERIPVERRAEAALIAWMRHQTTAYDSMKIAREKGKRREVRRMLAERSRDLLVSYRRGIPVDPAVCPLYKAVIHAEDSKSKT